MENKTKDKFFVVGIGASAGGLESITNFFSNINTDKEIAFIVILHSSNEYKSHLPEIISKVTNYPTHEITHSLEIKPNNIYFLQAGTSYTIVNDKFITGNKINFETLDYPIDRIFIELSEYYKECMIGIILSGTGSDGTLGVKSIKEHGGLILVEDPNHAQFSGMPINSLAVTSADLVGSAGYLASRLENFINNLAPLAIDAKELDFTDEESFEQILNVLNNKLNIDFTQYKQPTLQRRIARRIAINSASNLKDYLQIIINDEKEPKALAKDFLIGVTRFFRDQKAFEIIHNKILPDIAERNDKNIKCWVIACHTGEEAYSLAILWSEYCHEHNLDINIKIFATDIDDEALSVASKGVYPSSIEADISKKRLNAFFNKVGDYYEVKPDIRSLLVFSRHNITIDPPFHRMDLISCRNLLIYMKPKMQQKILSRIHYALIQNGYLMLGPNENMGQIEEHFTEVSNKWRIYKNDTVPRKLSLEATQFTGFKVNKPKSLNTVQKVQGEQKLTEALNDFLLDEFELVCLFIDKNNTIINAKGDYTKYLQLPDRKFSMNLMKMLSFDLTSILSTAIRKALKENERIVFRNVSYRDKDKSKVVDVSVKPIDKENDQSDSVCMVVFHEKRVEQLNKNEEQQFNIDKVAHQQIKNLESELDVTKSYLQSTLEEMESSTEELQSSNEEILAANEELQSSNEELQSVNEELHTINVEHQEKIDQLAQLNDDIDNLLKSTKIGTLFLDMDQRIRKFTPAINTHFNLIESDIGRPISHISSNILQGENISTDIRKVITEFIGIEKEVQLKDGQWFLMRILPYITKENVIKGAVITFVNIEELKKATEHLHVIEQRWNSLVENATQLIAILDKERNIIFSNTPKDQFKRRVAVGSDFINLFRPEEQHKVQDQIDHIYDQKDSLTFEAETEYGFFEIILVPYKVNEEVVGIISIANDINDRIESSRKLKESEERFRKMADNSPVIIWMTDKNNQLIYLNKAWTDFTGRSIEEAFGEGFLHSVFTPDRKLFGLEFQKGRKRNSKIDFEFRLRDKNNKVRHMRTIGVPRFSETDDFNGYIGSILDIHEHKILDVKKDEFLNIASHELKTPLAIIKSYVQLILMEKEKVSDMHQNYLLKVNHEVNIINNLILDLLDISRIQAGKLEIRKTTFNMEDLIKDTIENLQSQFNTNRIKFTNNAKSAIKADKNRIAQVLNNLISNALKFSPEEQVIEVIMKEGQGEIETKVKDRGIGISAENREKIFNRYYQIENQKDLGGIGLGLFICKDIINRHGGKIGVHSEPGKGSEFFFTLPKK